MRMKMTWTTVEPDFDYFKPIDFFGDWLNVVLNVCQKKTRAEIKERILGQDISTFKIVIGTTVMVLVILLTFVLSTITMVIYYGTLPIRFLVDVICALYSKFQDFFYW